MQTSPGLYPFRTMHPILKDWLQNLGCLVPLGFLGLCMAFITHWVSTETGPARIVIVWQARILEGQYFDKVTMAAFILPALIGAWLVYVSFRRFLTRLGVYDRPTNAGFKRPNEKIYR
ncbi:hypothetical protein D0962_30425 [Leptolyngbyaceae cyanobacterium CCMR0082]|uniref:Uncharacterized protein n=3 Tax=Adonisia TaxID=2950183 RepID=A0A6M0SET8_9CYAN|nr:hypothetical protein [Adonisia turfae CCMR0081]NEZ67018.1 hypothetical protein [Adonisia turfae CCMR0082]